MPTSMWPSLPTPRDPARCP